MFPDIAITHYLLTFGSSFVTLALGFLLLGIRIPKREELKKLRTARIYLSGAYFILAASNFFSYFIHVEAEKDAVLMASTLFIASYQAFLFTTTCITFIRPAYVNKPYIVKHLLLITTAGIPLVLVSLFAEDTVFPYLFYACIALYVLQMFWYVHLFRREYGQSLKQLEAYYDEDENYRLRWVRICFYSAFGIGILALVSLFAGNILYCIFIVAYTVYYSYMVYRFYNYMTDAGFLIPALSAKSASAGDVVAEEDAELTEDEIKRLSEKEYQLKAALERWVENKEYCRGDVSVEDIALSLGTNRNFFRYYFQDYMPADFRTWRIALRVAEAKRVIEEYPEISLNEVCRMVGFNYLSNFHRQFQKIDPLMTRFPGGILDGPNPAQFNLVKGAQGNLIPSLG